MKVAIVIRLSAFGDVLLTGPAVSALAATHRVVFVTDPHYVDVVGALPGVSEVRPLDRKLGIRGARELGVALRSLSPSLVIDLQNKVRTQLLARTIGAPMRTLARRSWGQSVAALVGQDTILNDEHQSVRYLRTCVETFELPRRLGPLALRGQWTKDAEGAAAVAGWAPGKSVFAVAPAATHATKGWPIARYAEAVRTLVPPTAGLLIVAGPKDAAALTEFRAALGERPGVLDASALPLTTMAALLVRCRWLLGNDSGPIHLATALGVPTVAVFGPTSARRWGPLPGTEASHRVARLKLECAPCSNHGGPKCPLGHHDCLQKLSVDQVLNEVTAVSPR